ncbi:MAG: prepilin-type N-terminal cleavage/methylation domain-containing protein [Gammaproteobacteria bacterium]|nr:prepilin-type N-terminal cleavage/methylation domain-containing protein [Gammaproteobacteria bacterium]
MSLVSYRHDAGFSLIELITVVVLLSILGVVALGRFGNQDAFAARGFFDDTVAAVRFAQKFAVSSGCEIRVVTTASSYQLLQGTTCTAGDFADAVDNPANRGQPYLNSNMPAGFSLTAGSITFDAEGLRSDGPPAVFTLTDGSTSYSFEVHGATGLVEVL